MHLQCNSSLGKWRPRGISCQAKVISDKKYSLILRYILFLVVERLCHMTLLGCVSCTVLTYLSLSGGRFGSMTCPLLNFSIGALFTRYNPLKLKIPDTPRRSWSFPWFTKIRGSIFQLLLIDPSSQGSRTHARCFIIHLNVTRYKLVYNLQLRPRAYGPTHRPSLDFNKTLFISLCGITNKQDCALLLARALLTLRPSCINTRLPIHFKWLWLRIFPNLSYSYKLNLLLSPKPIH